MMRGPWRVASTADRTVRPIIATLLGGECALDGGSDEDLERDAEMSGLFLRRCQQSIGQHDRTGLFRSLEAHDDHFRRIVLRQIGSRDEVFGLLVAFKGGGRAS